MINPITGKNEYPTFPNPAGIGSGRGFEDAPVELEQPVVSLDRRGVAPTGTVLEGPWEGAEPGGGY